MIIFLFVVFNSSLTLVSNEPSECERGQLYSSRRAGTQIEGPNMGEFLLLFTSSHETCYLQVEGFQMLPESNAHSRDSYSFGMMVETLISHLNDFGE